MIIRLQLDLQNTEGACVTKFAEFEVTPYLDGAIDDWIEDYNVINSEDKWEVVDKCIDYYDDAYADPSDFGSLDEYGEYVEKCEEHGEAYVLRYEDIGDFDFDDQYRGCWNSEEDFVQDLWEQCMEVPDNLWGYIDWESVTRDTMMDYSSYDGSEGCHIFSDC